MLPKSPAIPDIVTAGLPTVGLRMPAHPVALRLIEAAGVPIAAPSANRFMDLSPTTAAACSRRVRRRGGGARWRTLPVGIESTVVSLVGGKLTLLRPGMISLGELNRSRRQRGRPHPAPGMHARHYSPRTRLLLVDGPKNFPDRHGAYVWWKQPGLTTRSVHMPAEPDPYAARLYDVLHRLDAENWPWIAVESPPATPEWAAILDRLRRAAGNG